MSYGSYEAFLRIVTEIRKRLQYYVRFACEKCEERIDAKIGEKTWQVSNQGALCGLFVSRQKEFFHTKISCSRSHQQNYDLSNIFDPRFWSFWLELVRLVGINVFQLFMISGYIIKFHVIKIEFENINKVKQTSSVSIW